LLPRSRSAPVEAWTEAELAEAWAERRYRAHWLVDCCGQHLRVVFPGRRWGGPGPDFRGAVLARADGVLVRGDVEIHVRARSWLSHGHAHDPAYRQVVLHVVVCADTMTPAPAGGQGVHIPTVVLEPLPRAPEQDGLWPSHAPCVREAPEVLGIVRAAGRERFRARAARFEGDLAVAAADQVLWRGVCEALGYRRNAQAFGQLAEAVPWLLAAEVVVDRGPVGLAGLLLGTAGLLSESTLAEAHAWRALQRTRGLRPALSAATWDRRQVRAANAPAVRCRGLAELAARWTRPPGRWLGPAGQVLAAVRQAAGEPRPRLWRMLQASPWIGRGRAQVIAINVLLPLAAAAGIAEAALLFERLPGEPSNRIVRYMAEQLGRSERVQFRGACLQQGLLQLFKQTCAARLCERCPARYKGVPDATTQGFGTSNDQTK
jgi:hypothetical protein